MFGLNSFRVASWDDLENHTFESGFRVSSRVTFGLAGGRCCDFGLLLGGWVALCGGFGWGSLRRVGALVVAVCVFVGRACLGFGVLRGFGGGV